MSIAAESRLGKALLLAGGRLESGSICSPGRYRIEPIHLRIVGDYQTLCGQRLSLGSTGFRWQWYSQGQYNERLPSYATADDHYRVCRSCARSEVYRITAAVMEQKRAGRLT